MFYQYTLVEPSVCAAASSFRVREEFANRCVGTSQEIAKHLRNNSFYFSDTLCDSDVDSLFTKTMITSSDLAK